MNKISQKSVVSKVQENIRANNLINPNDAVILALSGGPDSVCLFDVLFKLKDKLNFHLIACHYNHRLRGRESYNDEEFVKKLCTERGIECVVGSAPKENLYKNEESARAARYGFFEKILGERRGAKIAIAHNKNDLSETFLMRLFRGTGMLGLKSIPSVRENFIRPLLSISRLEIESYLKMEKISFCTDKTNKDLKLTRNLLRHKIIPLLTKHINPNLIDTLSNSAKVIEDDYNLIWTITKSEYKNILVKKDEEQISLDRKKWLLLHPSLQRSVIRMAILNKAGLENITNKQIFEVCEMITRGEGRKFKVLPSSLRIELVSGKIILSKKENQ